MGIVDRKSLLQTACRVLQLVQVERLWLVELVPVGSSDLIGVDVLLSSPGGTIPQLSVTFVTCEQVVRMLFDVEF